MAGTISTLGVGSGIDLQGTLDQLREVDNEQIYQKEEDIQQLEEQLQEFTETQATLLEMKSLALDLSLESTFMAREVSVSNSDVLSIANTEGATVQSTSITVESLASQSSWLSAGFDSEDSLVTAAEAETQTFGYQVGENGFSLSVAAGTTLLELKELINDSPDNLGVTASLINNGDPDAPFQLVLMAEETGEESRISFYSQLTDLSMTEQQGAGGASLNAQFSVNGIDYQRQSNTIEDVLPSLAFTLSDTGSSTITVANDTEGLQEMIVNLVETYNQAISDIKLNSGYDLDEEEFGLLASTSFDDLPYLMQNLMMMVQPVDATAAETPVTSMFDLGMEYFSDGTISLDQDTLAEMFETNFEGVQAFFLGDEESEVEGFADQLNDYLRNVTTEEGGIYESEVAIAQQKIERLEEEIEKETERLDKKYEALSKQFVQLDMYMAEMENLSGYLAQTFSGDE